MFGASHLRLLWFTGLVQHAEKELHDTTSDELVPNFFRTVQGASRSLPAGWRPGVPLSSERAQELRAVSEAASESYRQQMEELHFKELHAKQVGGAAQRASEARNRWFLAVSRGISALMFDLRRCPRRWTAQQLSSMTP